MQKQITLQACLIAAYRLVLRELPRKFAHF
jgi:hypothetical protein